MTRSEAQALDKQASFGPNAGDAARALREAAKAGDVEAKKVVARATSPYRTTSKGRPVRSAARAT